MVHEIGGPRLRPWLDSFLVIAAQRGYPAVRYRSERTLTLAEREEPLMLDGNVLVAEDALVYGRLTQSKESGTFTGRSQLRLELTGIVSEWKVGARGDGRL